MAKSLKHDSRPLLLPRCTLLLLCLSFFTFLFTPLAFGFSLPPAFFDLPPLSLLSSSPPLLAGVAISTNSVHYRSACRLGERYCKRDRSLSFAPAPSLNTGYTRATRSLQVVMSYFPLSSELSPSATLANPDSCSIPTPHSAVLLRAAIGISGTCTPRLTQHRPRR